MAHANANLHGVVLSHYDMLILQSCVRAMSISNHSSFSYYRPQRSCGQGYVFTRVCDSVHRGGSPGTPPQARQGDPPGRETPPAGRTPPLDQADPPGWENPPGPGRHPPGPGRPPRLREPPQTRQTPPGPGRHPPPGPGRHPPGSRLQNTVYERPVRILLKCILVFLFCRCFGEFFFSKLPSHK